MMTMDLDKLSEVTPNKFYLVLAIVDRVLALKAGTEPTVERRGRDLISVAVEEFEKGNLDFIVQDNYQEMIQRKKDKREL